MLENFYTTEEVAKAFKINKKILTNMLINGEIRGIKLKSGSWLIPESAIYDLFEYNGTIDGERINVIYARVPNKSFKNQLDRMVDILLKFSVNNHIIVHDIIKDIRPGGVYNTDKLQYLLELILNHRVNYLLVYYPENVLHGSLDFFKTLCKLNGVTLLNLMPTSDDLGLIEADLIENMSYWSNQMSDLSELKSLDDDELNKAVLNKMDQILKALKANKLNE